MTSSLTTVSLSADIVPIITGTKPSTVSFYLFAVRNTVEVGSSSRLPIPIIFNISIPEQSTLAPVSATAVVFLAGNKVWASAVLASSADIPYS